MSTTIRKDMSVEKYGKSLILNSKNERVGGGKYGQEDLYLVLVEDRKLKKLALKES